MRDRFILEQEWAVRPRDIRRAILDFRPNIIHFCGHGAGSQGLCFQDEAGNLQLVTGEVLADLFKNFATQIECVLLNACYSEVQADAIVQHIDYVIGMNAPINDKPAIEFAVGFYDGLAGYDPERDQLPPVEFAFNLGCNAIGLAGLSGNDPRNAVRLNAGVSVDIIPVLKKNPNIFELGCCWLKRNKVQLRLRSPLAPLKKGGTGIKVPLKKGGNCLKVPLKKGDNGGSLYVSHSFLKLV
ncbi:CHAT domain-containing protein [Fischerella sp. PCC 9605]|uniref:CHAT domain-containing protein n=1 Tax=Fischerella sp. PCC 9605 TaxID=1173024 RepID=UPI000686E9C8|nr:CHAT domain-containing protein [Fischerella sp. PCC 9605]